MNIKDCNSKKVGQIVQPLFESNNFPQAYKDSDKIEIKQQQQIETMFSVKSKQFKLDCGIVLGSLNSNLDELKLGLCYHDKKTSNFDEFLSSVESFLFMTGMSLSDGDKGRLKAHYKRYSIHKNTMEI